MNAVFQVRVFGVRIHIGLVSTDVHLLQTSVHLPAPTALRPIFPLPVKPVIQRTRHLSKPRQHDRVWTELQRVSQPFQDGFRAQRTGRLVEVFATTVFEFVTCSAKGGGDTDYDHSELAEVLPHRVGCVLHRESSPSIASYHYSLLNIVL